MKKTILKTLAIVILAITSQELHAQLPPPAGWENPSSSIGGRLEGNVTIEGVTADTDDYIAAFKMDGTFVGSANIVNGSSLGFFNLNIFGDDGTATNSDLMDSGDSFTLKVYDRSANTIFNVANATTGDPAEVAAWEGSNQSPPIPNPMTIDGVSIDNGYFDFAIDADDVDQILPIKLSSFEVNKRSCDTYKIQWTTELEINNEYFEVERSIDDLNSFEILAKITGAGDSFSEKAYTYDDRLSLNGHHTLYYRLKQVDFDGQYQVSNVIAAEMDCKQSLEMSVYPNPAIDRINIDHVPETAIITIINGQGQVIAQKNASQMKIVNTLDWPVGIYFIQQSMEGEIINTKRFSKQN